MASVNGQRTAPERTVLITGASSGIGAAFAEVFAAHGFHLILAARRDDRLRAVAARLERAHGVRAAVIVSDLSDPHAPSRLCAEITERGLSVDALVNNAGYGISGSYLDTPWDAHRAMLQVMVGSMAELTHRLLPAMIARGYGRVINVSSLAGLVPAPAGHTLYAATKALAVRFSEALSGEVARFGVHVTALCPGFTYSEFHDVTGTRDKVSTLPTWLWMDAAVVAQQGFDAVMAGTPLHVPGRVNRTIALLVRIVPMSIVNAVGRRIGSTYRKA
jgi:short-subunit dehydrogenase